NAERVTEPDVGLDIGDGGLQCWMGQCGEWGVLTERHGDNPNKWSDVRIYLPLLSKKQYYTQTKHGYARGWEPVHYVKKVRSYRKILEWYSVQEERRMAVVQYDRRNGREHTSESSAALSRNNLNTTALSIL